VRHLFSPYSATPRMLYLKRGAAAQVIAAKNSILEGERKFFLVFGGAQMPFFSGFAQTLVPGTTRGNET